MLKFLAHPFHSVMQAYREMRRRRVNRILQNIAECNRRIVDVETENQQAREAMDKYGTSSVVLREIQHNENLVRDLREQRTQLRKLLA